MRIPSVQLVWDILTLQKQFKTIKQTQCVLTSHAMYYYDHIHTETHRTQFQLLEDIQRGTNSQFPVSKLVKSQLGRC